MGHHGVLFGRLHLGESGLGFGLLAGGEIGLAQADLGIVGVLERLLHAALDHADGILGLALADHVFARRDQVVALGRCIGGCQGLSGSGGIGGSLCFGVCQEAHRAV